MISFISQTAAFVAVKLYGLTLREPYKSQFSSEIRAFYKAITGQLPKHLSWYHTSLDKELWRKFFIWSEELLLPGDLLHIVSRKFYMTKLLDKAISEGYQQVVVLGAGFDHLGYYASNKGLNVFESDTDAMIQIKQEFMKGARFENEHLHFLCINVNTDSIQKELSAHPAFDSSLPTVFITEGFFDYIDLPTSKKVLDEIASFPAKTKLLSTFFSLDELHPFYRFSFTSGVNLVGERLKLPLNKTEFLSLLDEHGYQTKQIISYTDMEEEFVKPMGVELSVLDGFYIVEAVVS